MKAELEYRILVSVNFLFAGNTNESVTTNRNKERGSGIYLTNLSITTAGLSNYNIKIS